MPKRNSGQPRFRHCSFSRRSECVISEAARNAASASSFAPALCRLPQTAMRLSPISLSTVPLFAITCSIMTEKYWFNWSTSSAGSRPTVRPVKLRRSEKSTVTGFRTPPSAFM